MLPNFLICGVAQGGTSYLAASIRQHPEIYMPRKTVPEPHFFLKSWEYQKGIESYSNDWFSQVRGEKAIGEKSSSYLYGGQDVALRIRKHLPDVRLIVMLRDPTERAWAHYRFSALNGIENLGFDEAIRCEPERIASQTGQWSEIQPFDYTGRSMYGRQLEQYLTIFPREQIFIVKSESFLEDPESEFSKVFRFLGVDDKFIPEKAPSFRSLEVKDVATQFKCRDTFGERLGLIIKAIRMREDPFVYAESDAEIEILEKLVANLDYERTEISTLIRTFLRKKFREDIDLVREFVNFPIDDWHTVTAA